MGARGDETCTSTIEARLDSIESRLRYLEDQEEIRECLARYGYAADLGRSRAWVDLWTSDGIYDLDDGLRQGRDELTELIAAPDGFHKSIENRCLHTVANLFIRIDADSAWAEGYSVVIVRETEPDRHVMLSCGYNHWDFRRIEGQWRLHRRYRRAIGGGEWGGNVIRSHVEG
jgi:hypothetical protein